MSIWQELEQLEKYTNASPELIRATVNYIKELGSEKFRVPSYDLPGDSFIRYVALKILRDASIYYQNYKWE